MDAAAGWVVLAEALAVDPVAPGVRLGVEAGPAVAAPAGSGEEEAASGEVVEASVVASGEVEAELAAGRAIAPR